ncbi:DNA-directed RNA polymerase subunit beta [bacterium]|nr:DNA-directed RNA polymerase subunit beta [bacterium]
MRQSLSEAKVSRETQQNQRFDFGKIKPVIGLPNLIEVQQSSFERFLQLDMLPQDRSNSGMEEIFQSVFPITNYNETASLEYVSYEIGTWECNCGKLKGMQNRYTYSCQCGRINGVGDISKMIVADPHFETKCSECGTEVQYTWCKHCETRVAFKMKYDADECLKRGMTYSAPLKLTIRLVVWDRDPETDIRNIRDIKEQEVYLGELPIMTSVYIDHQGKVRVGNKGTFIVNGTERVVVSQMHRSPGVFFKHDKGKSHASGRILYAASIIPYRGSWMEFEFDINDVLYVRIDRKRKIPATLLLRALGVTENEEIIRLFYEMDTIYLKDNGYYRSFSELLIGEKVSDGIVDSATGEVVLKAGKKMTKGLFKKLKQRDIAEMKVFPEDLQNKIIGQDIVDEETGEIYYEAGKIMTIEDAEAIFNLQIPTFKILLMEASHVGNPILETLKKDKIDYAENPEREAQIEIYRRLRPGDPLTSESARSLFERLFFNSKYYDLSQVGRLKINRKLGLEIPLDDRVLRKEDIIKVVDYLLKLKQGFGSIDDIDHLGNRRVRAVGELLQNILRTGLVRMERAIKERMSIQDIATSMPYDLINSKPITSVIKEFFGSSQLSQFMDQNNPLAELTHKRRLSALGPGGLSRERAGFEVRDVHPTHYGRICPIETPEGPNVGLITSLSTYARVNEFGFLETPYRKIKEGKVTAEIDYLTALDEEKTRFGGEGDQNYVIVQANAPIDEKTGNLKGERVQARKGNDFIQIPPKETDYMDVSPKQLVSVSASLIPFLENDDANRALMGSNMQRQAVPLMITDSPVVGTGMEAVVAKDSGVTVVAVRGGIVESVSADRIIIRSEKREIMGERNFPDAGVDVYNLIKFQRSNQNTCYNQKPIVRKGQTVEAGQIIADGPATQNGELALGRNILAAFMPWRGYNYEDAILMSETVLMEDRYTSIHIEEFELEARDTKLGKEDITRDIPNSSDEALRNLDQSGIIRIGAQVIPGDILVGKVTPKGETKLTPEEELLRAIFGEKAGDVRDASLITPPGIEGTVIDVKVFSRKSAEKDQRSKDIEDQEISRLQKEYEDEAEIIREEKLKKLQEAYAGQKLKASIKASNSTKVLYKKGATLPESYVETLNEEGLSALNVVITNTLKATLNDINRKAEEQLHIVKTILKNKINRLQKGEELPPGVIKLVKVYIAVKRKMSVGDKMAGRHGNKGVIAKILPIEDMPLLPNGDAIEIILNPLGVPSRMNVGQILETHLGLAAQALGYKIATPVFDGATETEIRKWLKKANLPSTGQLKLRDGRTGDYFDQAITVGYIYMLKLNHLAADKIHARSIGPYSLVTQQPLGGKAQFGGQRFGEMEVWALEAYGAAFTLQELLTVKSDDVAGRTKIYQSIVKGENVLEAGVPESFNVLFKELQSLALDVELIDTKKQDSITIA